MPVVINQFEIVAEAESQERGQEASPDEQATALPMPMLTPHDIELVVRHMQERLARVRAH